MAGVTDELLEVDLVIAECGLRFTTCRRHLVQQTGLLFDDAHPATATTPARLQHQRETDFIGETQDLRIVVRQRIRRRHDRHVGSYRKRSRFDLVAEPLHGLRCRTDKGDAGLRAHACEVGILREESVTRMDCIGAGVLSDPDDVLHIQIRRYRALALADQIRLAGVEAMQGQAILGRIDADGWNVQLTGRAKHADRNLAAIGDEDLVEHRN